MEWFDRSGTMINESRAYDVNLEKETAKYDYTDRCSRCGGAGKSDKWMFTGRVCFDCGGSGKGKLRTARLYTAPKLAKLNATEAKRNAIRRTHAEVALREQQERRAQARRLFDEEHGDLITRMERFQEKCSFLGDLLNRLTINGSLSPAQIAAARNAVEREETRKAAREASQFVGEINQRAEFALTVERVIRIESPDSFLPSYARMYPTRYIHLCRDASGNRIVYKGSGSFPGKDETAKVRATISGHEEYNGEKQTIISRPKLIESQHTEVSA